MHSDPHNPQSLFNSVLNNPYSNIKTKRNKGSLQVNKQVFWWHNAAEGTILYEEFYKTYTFRLKPPDLWVQWISDVLGSLRWAIFNNRQNQIRRNQLYWRSFRPRVTSKLKFIRRRRFIRSWDQTAAKEQLRFQNRLKHISKKLTKTIFVHNPEAVRWQEHTRLPDLIRHFKPICLSKCNGWCW